MDMFDALGIAAIVAAFALLVAVGTCQPETFKDCTDACGGSDRVARVEITSNIATCECRTEPALFDDYTEETLPDGTTYLTTPHPKV